MQAQNSEGRHSKALVLKGRQEQERWLVTRLTKQGLGNSAFDFDQQPKTEEKTEGVKQMIDMINSINGEDES